MLRGEICILLLFCRITDPLLHRYWHKQGLGTASRLLVSAVSAAAVFSHFFARLHGKVFNNNFLDFLIIFLVYFVSEVSSAD